jgi:hypothetical protein
MRRHVLGGHRLRSHFERRESFRVKRFRDIREDRSVPRNCGVGRKQTIQMVVGFSMKLDLPVGIVGGCPGVRRERPVV